MKSGQAAPQGNKETTMTTEVKDDLDRVQELFDFLQGEVPEHCQIEESRVPKLTANQAWTIIWYLGNQYFQVPDFIERCCVCGSLYNAESEGGHSGDGPPYHFCEECFWQKESHDASDPLSIDL